jgi:hypothetical protein
VALIGVTAALLFLSCCRPYSDNFRETLLDRNFGSSLETAKSSQILNRKAERNLEPVDELDGPASHKTIKVYRDGFENTGSKSSGSATNLGLIGK